MFKACAELASSTQRLEEASLECSFWIVNQSVRTVETTGRARESRIFNSLLERVRVLLSRHEFFKVALSRYLATL